ncbi:hypothetical protein HKD37_18G051263 [Glycine soja]
MLKVMCTLAKQDYKESTKDGEEDVAMNGTHDNIYVYCQALHCQNVNKRVSNPTVKCTTNEAYGKSKATLNNIETIFIPGDDDDDEFLRPLDRGMKAKFLGDENTTTYSSPKTIKLSGPSDKKTTDDSSPQHPFMSNYVRGLKAKDMPCTFKPTVDMNLTFKETQLSLIYIHGGNEILFGVGNNLGTRQNFLSLCPNKPIREEIILFMALKVAYSQLYRTRSVWCMPPTFVLDVIDGTPVEIVMLHYGKDWMPSFSNLKLIYIPIVQYMDHWYLMANVMLSVLESVFETQDLIFGFDGMDNWDIVEPRGIPNCGSSEKSALWVLEWMQMEESFVNLLYGVHIYTNHIFGFMLSIMYIIIALIYDIKLQLDEKAIRMKVAMILLLGTHNQYKGELIRNAERT